MSFGDWELFRATIASLKQTEALISIENYNKVSILRIVVISCLKQYRNGKTIGKLKSNK